VNVQVLRLLIPSVQMKGTRHLHTESYRSRYITSPIIYTIQFYEALTAGCAGVTKQAIGYRAVHVL
jgi:hypothetical protein